MQLKKAKSTYCRFTWRCMCGKTRAHFCRSVYKYGSRTSLFRWSWLLHWWHWLITINTAHKIGQWIGQACVIPFRRAKYHSFKTKQPTLYTRTIRYTYSEYWLSSSNNFKSLASCSRTIAQPSHTCLPGSTHKPYLLQVHQHPAYHAQSVCGGLRQRATHMFGERAAGGRRKFANFVSGNT